MTTGNSKTKIWIISGAAVLLIGVAIIVIVYFAMAGSGPLDPQLTVAEVETLFTNLSEKKALNSDFFGSYNKCLEFAVHKQETTGTVPPADTTEGDLKTKWIDFGKNNLKPMWYVKQAYEYCVESNGTEKFNSSVTDLHGTKLVGIKHFNYHMTEKNEKDKKNYTIVMTMTTCPWLKEDDKDEKTLFKFLESWETKLNGEKIAAKISALKPQGESTVPTYQTYWFTGLMAIALEDHGAKQVKDILKIFPKFGLDDEFKAATDLTDEVCAKLITKKSGEMFKTYTLGEKKEEKTKTA